MKKWREFWNSFDNLRDRIYYSVLIIGALATLISLVVTALQGLGVAAVIITAVCFVFMVGLFVISVKYNKAELGRYILVYFLNIVFLPPIFVACGGVYSGMPMYYLLSIFALGILLDGKSRRIGYAISLIVLEISIIYSYFYKDSISLLSYGKNVEDVFITLIITSATVVSMLTYILNAYNKERERSHELLDRLRELSVKDELSGLYNRRELFRRLDNIYQSKIGDSVPSSKSGCFIAMFDIDNFKKLNDTYGHQFGDKVLSTVAGILKEETTEANGELAARYGGEEFVCIVRADDKDEALKRVERMRIKISECRWEDIDNLIVTISGGLASCEGYDDVNLIMHDVDSLLYKAKKDGKNQIKI